ncbi:MAG: zinc-ribbon domain-containing protein, partial [Nitrospiraceae bacterium]
MRLAGGLGTKCPRCQAEMPSVAESCPECGRSSQPSALSAANG